MPYPCRFPYDWLDASPDDSVPILQKKWREATGKRRAEAQPLRIAFDELKKPLTRLSYDVLLVTDAARPTDVTGLVAQLGRPVFLPERAEPPPITLALTDLAGDATDLYQPIQPRDMPITGSKRFAALPPDVLDIPFDR